MFKRSTVYFTSIYIYKVESQGTSRLLNCKAALRSEWLHCKRIKPVLIKRSPEHLSSFNATTYVFGKGSTDPLNYGKVKKEVITQKKSSCMKFLEVYTLQYSLSICSHHLTFSKKFFITIHIYFNNILVFIVT